MASAFFMQWAESVHLGLALGALARVVGADDRIVLEADDSHAERAASRSRALKGLKTAHEDAKARQGARAARRSLRTA